MFIEDTPWRVPWMERVLPQIVEVAARHPGETVFTRFIPPRNAEDAVGAWKDYYEKWDMMTREKLSPELIELPPSLKGLVPPAILFDKPVYSPWLDGRLRDHFRRQGVQSLVISGGETDVCVLATVLGAIDLGFKIIILSDGICSGADETHDAAVSLLADRFSVQLEIVTTESFLTAISQ
jgi:nicotinamidase-related amidase